MAKTEARSRIRELEQQLATLREENEFLTAAAEDMLLLGHISERVIHAAREESVYDALLEDLVGLKGLTWCGIAAPLSPDDERVFEIIRGASLGVESGLLLGTHLSLEPEIGRRLTSLSAVVAAVEVGGLEVIAPSLSDTAALVPIRQHGRTSRVLVAVGPNEILEPDAGRVLLERLRDIVEARLETLSALRDVQALNRALRQTIADEATLDPLTGLLNRAGVMRAVDQHVAGDEPFALLLLGLDRFHLINESLGHRVGDALLAKLGERLSLSLRPGDVIGRVGGDEFAMVVRRVDTEDAAARLAERLRNEVSLPFDLAEQQVFVTASLGVALGAEYDATADLFRDSDAALARAKARGSARFELVDPQQHLQAMEALALETGLRRAVADTQFVLHYQPIVELGGRRPVGFEALIRWEHPTRGMISPGVFIPLAEETGLIVDIGRWVLEEACRELVSWTSARPDAFMSVNVAARQLLEDDFFAHLQHVLLSTGLEPRRLKLEITESGLIQVASGVREVLESVRELGVGLCMDDFGTGYSSLSYLHRFPVDVLKIDRSFVAPLSPREDEHLAIVRTILSLGSTLQVGIVAEGVETEEQVGILHGLGCQIAQGYLFSRPVPAADAAALLRSS